MGQLGETLKNRRINLDISLEEAETATKIRKKYLEALENEDFASLPGMVYAKGFLRNYSRYLQLDPEELVMELEMAEQLQKPVREPAPVKQYQQKQFYQGPSKNRKRLVRLFLGIIAVVILLLVDVFWERPNNNLDTDKPATKQQNPTNQNTSPANTDKAPDNPGQTAKPSQQTQPSGANETPESPATEEMNLLLKAVNGRCWMQVWGDGKLVFEGMLAKGQEKSFSQAKEFKVKFGNAGAVQVFYNGNDMGTAGPYGKVITATYPKAE